MRVCTIGFSGKSAETFFETLRNAGVEKVIDIRRSNNTLYSGFTRSRDLPYFLEHLCGIAYVHEPEFAPSLALLRDYQKQPKNKRANTDAWLDFENRFKDEIAHRPIMPLFQQHTSGTNTVCLLCTESTPDHCHRRLLAEYIEQGNDDAIEILHL
jgi:uncharacterized protein (DUF488 family)